MKQEKNYRHQLAKSRGDIIKAGLPGLSGPITTEREMFIRIDEIAPSPHQTRSDIKPDSPDIIELAENIQKVGLINPIIVRPNPDQSSDYKWILVAGERRLAAHKRLGRTTIKASIRETLKDDELKSWSVTLSENIMRKPLKPDEAGEAIEIARNMNMNNRAIAETIGVSERYVIHLYGATKLPEDLRTQLEQYGKLTKRHIEAFKRLIGTKKITELPPKDGDTEEITKTKKLLLQLLNEVIDDDLSGEDAIKRAKELLKPSKKNKSFLTTLNKRVKETLKRRPTRMSDDQRRLAIQQAEEIIRVLQEFIKEEKTKLEPNPNQT